MCFRFHVARRHRPDDWKMEQREREKRSRQRLSQQYALEDEVDDEEPPLFNAPIRVAHSDDRIQSQLGRYELAKPLMEKFMGLASPSQQRSVIPATPLLSSGQHNNHIGSAAVAAGMPSSGIGGNDLAASSSSSMGYSQQRNPMTGYGSSGPSSHAQAVSASQPGFLKPKDAKPLTNGVSSSVGRYQPGQPPSGYRIPLQKPSYEVNIGFGKAKKRVGSKIVIRRGVGPLLKLC